MLETNRSHGHLAALHSYTHRSYAALMHIYSTHHPPCGGGADYSDAIAGTLVYLTTIAGAAAFVKTLPGFVGGLGGNCTKFFQELAKGNFQTALSLLCDIQGSAQKLQGHGAAGHKASK